MSEGGDVRSRLDKANTVARKRGSAPNGSGSFKAGRQQTSPPVRAREKSNGVLQDVAAKFCAYLVRPHFSLYFALGILLAFLDRMFGIQILQGNEFFLSGLVMPPIILMFGLQGMLFCVHFYKEQFRKLVPYNPLSQGSFFIPGTDKTFYETITGDIGLSRKIAGYMYALSKPITFTLSGAILTAVIGQNF